MKDGATKLNREGKDERFPLYLPADATIPRCVILIIMSGALEVSQLFSLFHLEL